MSVGTAANTIEVGAGAQATSPGATAIGVGAIASGSTAVGANAMATGADSAAFGRNAAATGAQSTALGKNSTAANANSTAIGQGVATSADNQIALGSSTQTLTVAGITSATSLTAQGAVTGLVTTDASGNLASDGGALQTQVTTNTAGITANVTAISLNTSGITANNTAILLNTAGINTNRTAISANLGLILGNTQAINELREGQAAIASIPDLYLQRGEKWTMAGGLSSYDDGYGGVEVGFGGGMQFRVGNKDSHASFGVAAAVSGSTYTARLQARIGG